MKRGSSGKTTYVIFVLIALAAVAFGLLSNKGPRTVNELTEALKLSKSQLYYLLKHLRQQKFIKASAKRPTTFSATNIETILNLIINSKIQQAEKMKASKKLFLNKKL